jgi:hypothetical protein
MGEEEAMEGRAANLTGRAAHRKHRGATGLRKRGLSRRACRAVADFISALARGNVFLQRPPLLGFGAVAKW